MVAESTGDACDLEAPLTLDPALFPRRLDLELSPVHLARLESIAAASGRSLSEVATDLLSRCLLAGDQLPG